LRKRMAGLGLAPDEDYVPPEYPVGAEEAPVGD
jgi:hypothetical protein